MQCVHSHLPSLSSVLWPGIIEGSASPKRPSPHPFPLFLGYWPGRRRKLLVLLKIWYFSRSCGCWQEREKGTEPSQGLQGTLRAPTARGRRCCPGDEHPFPEGMQFPAGGGITSARRAPSSSSASHGLLAGAARPPTRAGKAQGCGKIWEWGGKGRVDGLCTNLGEAETQTLQTGCCCCCCPREPEQGEGKERSCGTEQGESGFQRKLFK